MVEIIRSRDVFLEAELTRDFKPLRVDEGNYAYEIVGADQRRRIIHRRQRKIFYVSKLDANRIVCTVNDLGSATNAPQLTIPCGDGREGTDVAQAFELLDWAERERVRLNARAAEVDPQRTAAFITALNESNEEVLRRRKGQSTFAASGVLVRSS